jgi:ElaA protein
VVRAAVGRGDGPVPLSDIRTAAFDELDPRTLYAILRLRAQVFVVEQRSLYLDPDGRDLEPATRHCWIPLDEGIAAYLRVLVEPGGERRIGRVVTAPAARGLGYAEALVRHAIGLAAGPVVLDAQTYLADWYARFGFEPDGPEFVEDGIPHVPMRRS